MVHESIYHVHIRWGWDCGMHGGFMLQIYAFLSWSTKNGAWALNTYRQDYLRMKVPMDF